MAGNTVEIRINASGNADKQIKSVSSSLGGLAKAVGSPVAAVGNLVTKFGMFGIGVQGVQTLAAGVGQLGSSLLSGNNAMEQASARIQAFTKDAGLTQSILAAVRKEADSTPFAFNEMATAVGGLMPAAKMANEPLMDLLKTAEVLAASNPAEGLEGAAFALREAVSGDFTSIIERFNLPRVYINQLKAEGVPALEAVRKAMLEMGFDTDLVSGMAQTAQGRWSTFMDTVNRYKDILTQPIFEVWKEGLAAVQGWLDANSAKLEDWAVRGAASISLILGYVKELAPVFTSALMSTLSVVWSIGQLIYEALSYLNPFATHSPSLVSQVQSGVALINAEYGTVAGIMGPLNVAKGAILNFAQTADAGMAAYTQHVTDARMKSLQTFGADMPMAFTQAQAAMVGVENEIFNLNLAIISQSQVIQEHRAALQALDDELYALQDQLWEAQQAMGDGGGGGFGGATLNTTAMLKPFQEAVEQAQELLQGLQGELNGAKAELDRLTGMNIKGTKAFTDQMFALEQRTKMAELGLLNLKMGGGTKEQIKEAEAALQALRNEATRLKLEEELRTDPLKKQIQDLAKPMEELPFPEIIKGIKEAQGKINTLTPAIALQEGVLKGAQASLKEQTRLVQEMAQAMGGAAGAARQNTEAIKALQAAIREKEKERREAQKDLLPEEEALADLQTQRSTLQGVLNDWSQFVDGTLSKATQWESTLEAAAKAAEKAAKNTAAMGSGGDLGILSGDGAGLAAKIKETTDQIKKDLNFDETLAAWKTNAEQFSANTASLATSIQGLVEVLQNNKASLEGSGGAANAFTASLDPLRTTLAFLSGPLESMTDSFRSLTLTLQELLGGTGGDQGGKGMNGAIVALGNIAAAVAAIQFAPLILGFNSLIAYFDGMAVGLDLIAKAWDNLVGRWKDGDWWGVVVAGVSLIVTAFIGVLTPVIASVTTFVGDVLGLFGTLIGSIIGFFQGLYDTLVGSSIVPDLVNGILLWFETLWTQAQAPFVKLRNFLVGSDGKTGLWGGLRDTLDQVTTAIHDSLVGADGDSGLFGSIRTGIEGIAGGIKGIILGMVNASIRGINALLGLIRNLKVEIPRLEVLGAELFPGVTLGFKVPENLAEIPALAEGGIVLSPTLAMLGERGREAVIPLDEGGEFAEQIGRAIARELRRYPQINNTFNNPTEAVQTSWAVQAALAGA